MAITAERADFPKEVWLGKVGGNWPVHAFTTERHAQEWAAENDPLHTRYILGPIDLDLSVEVRKSHIRPAEAQWD